MLVTDTQPIDLNLAAAASADAAPKDLTTTELLARCHVGDSRAWDEVVARYGRLVYSVARRHRLSTAECDDVVQATWVRLLQRTGSIRNPESLADWLATVARNEALRTITRDRRAVPMAAPLDGAVPVADSSSDPVHATLRNDDVRMVAEAMQQMSPQNRELLTLVLMDPPLSYAEIGERLGMAPSSVGPTRTRCLRRLRRILGPMMAEENGSSVTPAPAAGRAVGRPTPTRGAVWPTATPVHRHAGPAPARVTEAFSIVRRCVAEVLHLPDEVVTPHAALIDDLGAVSLDIVEILFRIERETDVLLPFDDLISFVRGDVALADFVTAEGVVTDAGRRQVVRALPQWTDATLPTVLHAADIVGLVSIANLADRLDARLRTRVKLAA
ncbi:MAG: sigma-70 family RNA polymerase sigma factor [Tetrasphaera sp.]